MKRSDRLAAIDHLKTFDPAGYADFLESLGDTPLNKIKRTYGSDTAEAVSQHFIDHPSDRYREIMERFGGA